jgi:hypothetical protein
MVNACVTLSRVELLEASVQLIILFAVYQTFRLFVEQVRVRVEVAMRLCLTTVVRASSSVVELVLHARCLFIVLVALPK